ncbi:uncharacterized protein LOC111062044 [Nilaparvata lugens]|uniref:uncharacterized protein LOC111062044 n=1 Tax=Nilaparvata lugens TaxID=108931 RepID=UPI00193D16F0|nr:uncharacterized protein LOC111062044 [Nilaparvata lugens]
MDKLVLITYCILILQILQKHCLGGVIHQSPSIRIHPTAHESTIDESDEDISIEDERGGQPRRFPLLPMMTSSTGSRLNTVELVIRPDESEVERAERTNREFEKLIQLATIVGQVDSFITHKARIIIRALAKLTEEDEADIRHYH